MEGDTMTYLFELYLVCSSEGLTHLRYLESYETYKGCLRHIEKFISNDRQETIDCKLPVVNMPEYGDDIIIATLQNQEPWYTLHHRFRVQIRFSKLV